MCGIAGIWSSDRKSVAGKRVEQMLDVMAWRGPDARGTWYDERVSLGHLRLSIIDLSDNANQPMTDERGRCVIFNGEIYNYVELREELKSRYGFKTKSNTEVILAAYDVWGDDCVRHFNGDWAFVLYDNNISRLLISRDRFGIKPLYYYHSGNEFMFASEVRALLAGGAPRNVRR